MNFKNFFQEEVEKHAVFTFGRMNPPTVGHEKVINKSIEFAKFVGGTPYIFVSHSHDAKKNPLAPEHKVKAVKATFKGVKVAQSNKEMSGPIQIAKHLNQQGYSHITMIAGSDRVNQYKKLLNDYNGKEYHFKSIDVISAGNRDPDAEGTEGVSGTKMREHAAAGNKAQFKKHLMSGLTDKHKEEIYHHTRAGMGVKEDKENPVRFDDGTPEGTNYMRKMTPGEGKKEKTIREKYFNNEIFKLGDIVETSSNKTGEIVYRGTNYVTVKIDEETIEKHWLDSLTEAYSKKYPKKQYEEAPEEDDEDDEEDDDKKKPAEVEVNPTTEEKKKTLTYSEFQEQRKIPVLLMTKEQQEIFSESAKENAQIEYMGYRSKNFEMCPTAKKKFEELIGSVEEPVKHRPLAHSEKMKRKFYTEM